MTVGVAPAAAASRPPRRRPPPPPATTTTPTTTTTTTATTATTAMLAMAGGATMPPPADTRAAHCAAVARAEPVAAAFVARVGPVPLFVDVRSNRSKHDFAKWRKMLCDLDAPSVVDAWAALHAHLVTEVAMRQEGNVLRHQQHQQRKELRQLQMQNKTVAQAHGGRSGVEVAASTPADADPTAAAASAASSSAALSPASDPCTAPPRRERDLRSHAADSDLEADTLHWEHAKVAAGRAIISCSLDPAVIGSGKSTNIGRQIKSCIEDPNSKKNKTATFGSVANVMLRIMAVVERCGGDRGGVGALSSIARTDPAGARIFRELADAFDILQCDLACVGNILGSDWLVKRAGRAVAEIVFCAANAGAIRELYCAEPGNAQISACGRPPASDGTSAVGVRNSLHGDVFCAPSNSVSSPIMGAVPAQEILSQKRLSSELCNGADILADGKRRKAKISSIVHSSDVNTGEFENCEVVQTPREVLQSCIQTCSSPPGTPAESDEIEAIQHASHIASCDSLDLEAAIRRLAGINPPQLSEEVLNEAHKDLLDAFAVFRGEKGVRTYKSREVEQFLQASDPHEELQFLCNASIDNAAGWKSSESQIDVRNFCGGACDGNLDISYLFLPWKVVDKLIIGYICRHAVGCTPFDPSVNDLTDRSQREAFEIGRFCANQRGEVTMIMRADGNRARVVHARHESSRCRFHSKTVCDLELLRENKWKDAVRQHTPGRCFRECIECKHHPAHSARVTEECCCKVPVLRPPRCGSDFQMLHSVMRLHAGDYTGEGKHLFRADKVGLVHADVMTSLHISEWLDKEEQRHLLLRLSSIIRLEVSSMLTRRSGEYHGGHGRAEANSTCANDDGIIDKYLNLKG